MNPKNARTQSGQPRPSLSPAPRKRFRIEKLEERIAPKRGGNGTRACEIPTVGCNGGPSRSFLT